MVSTNDLRTGLTIEVDGEIYSVVDFQHVKPGKGSAFVRTKLKNIRTGGVIERTFRAGEKLPRAHLERKEMQYLYREGDSFVFMDNETYDQVSLTVEQMGDSVKYLKENMNIWLLTHNGALIGIELPNSVELKVVSAEPGVRGDTATGATKAATLETGLVIQVPLFVEEGDVVRVDTRTGEYLERA
ncbi:translation elongation factor P [Thermacetogenium phaeum DSM 12270]|jgi:elongation factor P|uniref:Elongation factor P n=2 Tax=Thermacetogenium phaeum TaxID=85874 RepID=K4LG88_THEPS|nr:elongation factor P [Thermacetogenium phaeum]MDK2881444.1 elongation factor [Clostridia bacterium]MDN5365585.1 elongation factor [Thermacetogenium sp.]AFV11853.1 translation elongation factor P [Thermacetogenium phaeum DSM 12270]KUK35901.1 MAG: Elongation factor P [Thermacetogenium phaeum]MDN5376140.1 elongation factor [Thermacetogenium sp.]